MFNWINVAIVDDFPVGTRRIIEHNGLEIAIFNLNGEFYAIENICTHDGGDLTGAQLEGDEIICPRHGAKFCIKTGAVTAPPAYEDVLTFPVRVENGHVQIRLESPTS